MEVNLLNQIKQKNLVKMTLKTYLFLNIIKFCLVSQCPDRERPFYKYNYCSDTCTKQELDNNQCIIENEIIKEQWFNNINFIGGRGCAFVNLITSEDNNLYYIASAYPNSNLRYFFLLDKEGYGILDKNYPFSIIEINDNNTKGKFESNSMVVKLYENDNNEYFLTIGKGVEKYLQF